MNMAAGRPRCETCIGHPVRAAITLPGSRTGSLRPAATSSGPASWPLADPADVEQIRRKPEQQCREHEGRPGRGMLDLVPRGVEEDDRSCACAEQEGDEELDVGRTHGRDPKVARASCRSEVGTSVEA